MDAANIVALVVATVGAAVALTSTVLDRRSRAESLATQRRELELAEARWLRQFNLDLAKAEIETAQGIALAEYEHRAATFPDVFRTLSAVRDVPDPVDEDHWRELERNRDILTPVAAQLLEHLYGPAGLFMHYDTRNRVLRAYESCLEWKAGSIDLHGLIKAFFLARRFLREDLNLVDGRRRVRLEDTLKDLTQQRGHG